MSSSERIQIKQSGSGHERFRNAARSNALFSRYCRLENKVHALGDRLRDLGAITSLSPAGAPEVQHKTRWMIGRKMDGVAVDYLNAHLAQVGRSVTEAQRALESRIMDLQRRFRELEDARQSLSHEYTAFMAFRMEGLPVAWPIEEKTGFINLYRQMAAAQSIPPYTPPMLSEAGVEQLETAERELTAARQRMAEAVFKLRQEKMLTEARLLQSRRKQDPSTRWLTSILPPLRPVEEPDETMAAVPARLDQLTAQLGAMGDGDGWIDLFRKIEYARQQAGITLSSTIYDDLAAETEGRIRQRQELDRWRNRIDELIDSVAHLRGGLVDEVIGQLEHLRNSEQVVALDASQIVLQQSAQRESARREREQRRDALIACFTELGYSFAEGQDRALTKPRTRALAARPRDNDFGAIVSVNEDMTTIETTLVRIETTGEMPLIPELRRRLELEQREAWKRDLSHMIGQMNERGFAAELATPLAEGLSGVVAATVPGEAAPVEEVPSPRQENLAGASA